MAWAVLYLQCGVKEQLLLAVFLVAAMQQHHLHVNPL